MTLGTSWQWWKRSNSVYLFTELDEEENISQFWIKLVALLKASLKQRWLLTWGDLTRPGTMMNHQLASEACKLFEHMSQTFVTMMITIIINIEPLGICRAVRQTTMVNHRALKPIASFTNHVSPIPSPHWFSMMWKYKNCKFKIVITNCTNCNYKLCN